MTLGVAEVNWMLPTSTPRIAREIVALAPPAVTVTTAVPAVPPAVKVPVALPETLVAVDETDPKAALVVIAKLTAVPSITLAPALSSIVAVMATVPRALTGFGVAVSVIEPTVLEVVELLVVPAPSSVTVSVEHALLKNKHRRVPISSESFHLC